MTEADAALAWARMSDLVTRDNDRRREVSEALGMSFAKVKALRRIAADPLTMRELAEQLITDRPYATLLVDDLEGRGLVERTVHPDDRRRKLVKVTREGRKAAALANRILGEPPPALLDLSEEDLAALNRILAQLSRTGDPRARTGDSRAGSGDTRVGSGDSRARTGDSRAGSGNSRARTGDTPAGIGDSLAGSGDTRAGIGDSLAGSGDTRAGIGDSRV